MVPPLVSESVWLWGGLAGYAASTAAAWHGAFTRRSHDRLILVSLVTGVALFAFSIAERWMRIGYGPFLTMFEILLSNLFSLGLIYTIAYWRITWVRPGSVVALPILLLLGLWLLIVSAEPSRLPATYDNVWLWVHVGVGKVFLGLCLVAVGIAGVLLLRKSGAVRNVFTALPGDETLDALAWRFMALAFVFHSLMLIAGAVWAQDAWGRYWAWDPLETWAFITWLTLGVSLHLRVTYPLPLWTGWWMIIGVFLVAFLTFFGVPFLSLAPHQGIL